jgi:hypothetical protein
MPGKRKLEGENFRVIRVNASVLPDVGPQHNYYNSK